MSAMYFEGLIITLVTLTVNGGPISETNFTESAAFDYLLKYGYVNESQVNVPFSSDPGPVRIFFRQVIKDFQDSAGLQITGELDADTIEVMAAPRCGVGAHLQGLRGDDQKWHKKTLTYRLMQYSRRVSNADVDRTVRRAMDFWEEAADIRFQKTSGNADIEIIFGTRNHGDGLAFDGPGGILAHAYFPGRSNIAGDAHFDDDESWSVTNYIGKQLLQTTTHELGHSLGLSHSKVQGSVMYFSYPGWNPRMKLDRDDITRIQRLYGQSRGRGRPITPTNPPTSPGNGPWFGPCVCQDYTRFDSSTFKSYGNCKTEYKGRKWCYVHSDASCADKQRSSKLNRDWSWEACKAKEPFTGCKEVNVNYPQNDIPGGFSKQGSWERCKEYCGTNSRCTHWTFRITDGSCWLKTGNNVKIRENDVISGPRDCQGGDCRCNGVTRYDARKDKTVGHCQTEYRGNYWCYISDDSQCGDKKETKRNKDGLRYWSASACEIETPFQLDTQIETIPLVFADQDIPLEGSP